MYEKLETIGNSIPWQKTYELDAHRIPYYAAHNHSCYKVKLIILDLLYQLIWMHLGERSSASEKVMKRFSEFITYFKQLVIWLISFSINLDLLLFLLFFFFSILKLFLLIIY